MQDCIRTVMKAGYGEYEEKRSRFLSFVFPVSAENDAVGILNDLKKKSIGMQIITAMHT
jgi:putative IMPACT (imprinted ancient) family translation regulator